METAVRNRTPSHGKLLETIEERNSEIQRLSKESRKILRKLKRVNSPEKHETLSKNLEDLYLEIVKQWDGNIEDMESFRSKPFRRKHKQ